MSRQAPLLSVNTLSYQTRQALLLNNISFGIQPGELVGIIGPNGAGKSTLLKCLSGFQPCSSGEVRVIGQRLLDMPHLQRAILMGYLPQYNEVTFPFSVMETIALGLHAKQQYQATSAKAIRQRTLELLDLIGIYALKDRTISELSGGERQLVHFARLLIQDTKLMLLDEPTASLDIGHESILMNVLYQQCRQGKSALVAIHNLNTAAEFCDRLLLLDKGKLVAQGQPKDVLTPERIEALYQDSVMVLKNPVTENVMIAPHRK